VGTVARPARLAWRRTNIVSTAWSVIHPATFAIAVGAAAALAALPGCSAETTDAAPPPAAASTEMCSQVHREIVRWQGRDVESRECGPNLTDMIELLPLGHGALLAHHRFSPPDERWELASDGSGTFARTAQIPLNGDWEYAGFTLLPPYAGTDPARLLVYSPRSSNWSLAQYSADGLKPEQTGAWPVIAGAPDPWDDVKGTTAGRQLVGLGEGLALDRSLGDGRVRLWRFVPDANGILSATPIPGLAGGPRAAFQRGHRLAPLGPGRLLEWLPVPCDDTPASAQAPACATFNVWTYSIDAAATVGGDPFPAQPAATGRWTDVGAGEEVLTDEGHVFVWTRATGRLRVYALSQTAVDPLVPTLTLGPSQTLPALASGVWEAPTRAAPLRHLLVILQDGHSFDGYFGRYCLGTAGPGGAPPACEDGAACCEGLPADLPESASCLPFDPAAPRAHQPNESPACLRAKMNGGAMDSFAGTHWGGCGDPGDVMCAGTGAAAGALGDYHALAARGALADRNFQTYAFVDGDGDPDGNGPVASIIDATAQNLIYLTAARFGDPFTFERTPQLEQELARMNVGWAIYAGPKARKRLRFFGVSESHDPTFYPYRALEWGELDNDLDLGQLPPVAVVLPDGDDPERSEAAAHAGPIDRPIGFVTRLIDRVEQSPIYRDDTLILFTYLTAGGTYDHVSPPAPPPVGVDAALPGGRAIHYGPRVPFLALGRFARPGHVSHVPMELSSVTAFIEWNWLSGRTLRYIRPQTDPRVYRDPWVNGIGSLLDPALQIP